MRLTDLSPELFTVPEPGRFQRTDYLSEARGIQFLCPKCLVDAVVPTHSVICWFANRGVDEDGPLPGRWMVTGMGLESLTLSPEIELSDGCLWRGSIEDGEVYNL